MKSALKALAAAIAATALYVALARYAVPDILESALPANAHLTYLDWFFIGNVLAGLTASMVLTLLTPRLRYVSLAWVAALMCGLIVYALLQNLCSNTQMLAIEAARANASSHAVDKSPGVSASPADGSEIMAQHGQPRLSEPAPGVQTGPDGYLSFNCVPPQGRKTYLTLLGSDYAIGLLAMIAGLLLIYRYQRSALRRHAG